MPCKSTGATDEQEMSRLPTQTPSQPHGAEEKAEPWRKRIMSHEGLGLRASGACNGLSRNTNPQEKEHEVVFELLQ